MGFKEDVLEDVERGRQQARVERCDSCRAFLSLNKKAQQDLNDLLAMDPEVVPRASIARILSKWSSVRINPGPFNTHVKRHTDLHVVQR